MIQFYFLSILTNLLGGLVLSIEYLEQKFPALTKLRDTITDYGFQFILGILTMIFGFLKLLGVTKGDIPVVGDLVPALSGLVIGFTLIINYYKSKSTEPESSTAVETLDNIFLKNKTIIGVVGIVVAIIHFIMPKVLFL
jgi:hypothetical protein